MPPEGGGTGFVSAGGRAFGSFLESAEALARLGGESVPGGGMLGLASGCEIGVCGSVSTSIGTEVD